MNARERVTKVLSGETPDRVPYFDSYWAETTRRWRNEGLPADMSADDYFGGEMGRFGGDFSLQFPVRVIEETERYRMYSDENGATRRDLRTADGWTPNWVDFQIKDRDDWMRHRDRATYNPSRIPAHLAVACAEASARGVFVAFSAHACFHPTWQKIGMENMLVLMIEDPQWITDMYAAHTRLITDIYDGAKAQGIRFDGAFIADDLGYRNAPLIAPAMYRELVKPYHKQLCDHFARDGLKAVLHSDGNVEPLIADFMEAGFAGLHPLEVKAGLDVRDLKPKYGDRLTLVGNIDVRQLAGTREEVEEEVRTKVTAGKEGGGYIFHSDHSVPSDVSFANYQLAVETLHKHGSYD